MSFTRFRTPLGITLWLVLTIFATTSRLPAYAAAGLRIADKSIVEVDAGTIKISFKVTKGATNRRATVRYATVSGTATSPGDFAAKSGTLTFYAGQTAKVVTILVVGDTLDEANETFKVKLRRATNAYIADGAATGTISDDDPLPVISVDDAAGPEGNDGVQDLTFSLTLTPASGRAVSVSYRTVWIVGEADGEDLFDAVGTLTFSAGQTEQEITLSINGDTTYENDETVGLELHSQVAGLLPNANATGTVQNDDPFEADPCFAGASVLTGGTIEGSSADGCGAHPDFARASCQDVQAPGLHKWYSYTIPAGQTTTLTLTSPPRDHILALHTGFATDQELQCEDAVTTEGSEVLAYQNTGASAATVYVYVGAYGAGDEGAYSLAVSTT